ncbi:hypothetical protein [Arhodomonas sp. AD133]|uniref:hypothetical protein n=1 Tax=Arhodomonas sp. AD133 TaxID=3415009 RepID=UPI003EC10220
MSASLERLALAAAMITAAGPGSADEENPEIQALKEQVAKLQQRVEALEQARTFTSFMPDFAERFHVLHRAGETGDWAVASHELKEMRRLMALSTTIDQENGELMQEMLAPRLDQLAEAIEHGSRDRLQVALERTVETCNACHAAAGSEFVRVSLDVPDSLNMRHPHRLKAQTAPEGHEH